MKDEHTTDTLPHKAEAGPSEPITDGFGRTVSYLRVSITDRCNQRCTYCRTPKDDFKQRDEILTFDEIIRVVRPLARAGVRKVRLTGGEPLVRKNAVELVGMLAEVPGIEDLTMTTNAVLLERYAKRLKENGLKRVNVSLDTLSSARYREITGGGELGAVLGGIDAAIEAGLTPVRLNTVVMRGINEDELADIIDYAEQRRQTLRFIECMPMRDGLDWKARYMPIDDVLKRPDIRERVETSASPRKLKEAAFFLPLRNGRGEVGFISPMSKRFCEECNRLRLTAEGRIRTCLPSDDDTELKEALRAGKDDSEILELVRRAVLRKPEMGNYNFDESGRARSMVEIGG